MRERLEELGHGLQRQLAACLAAHSHHFVLLPPVVHHLLKLVRPLLLVLYGFGEHLEASFVFSDIRRLGDARDAGSDVVVVIVRAVL